MPKQGWDLIRDNVITALYKDYIDNPTKLRPIGIGTSFRRMLICHIIGALGPKIAQLSIPYQYALGIPGGNEIIIQTILESVEQQFLKASPDQILLVFDFTNMFNSASRAATRSELEMFLDELLWLFDHLYPSDGN